MQLKVLQWLRANGCPRKCRYVPLDKGHVEVLRWARENGCPWIAQFRDRAAAELGYEGNLQSWPGGVGAPTCRRKRHVGAHVGRPTVSAFPPTCRRPTLATWSTSTAMINNQYSDECIRPH